MAIKHKIRIKADGTMKEVVLTRASAIHYHCIECSGYSAVEAGRCKVTTCTLWPFRTGGIDPACENVSGAGED